MANNTQRIPFMYVHNAYKKISHMSEPPCNIHVSDLYASNVQFHTAQFDPRQINNS